MTDTTSGEHERVPGERTYNRIWAFEPANTLNLGIPRRFDTTDQTVTTGRWGSGPDEFGVVVGNESTTDGPSAFAFEPDGDLVILDQINQRLLTYSEGSASAELTPIQHSGALGDIVVDATNLRYVLDDAADKRTIEVIRHDGTHVAALPPRT